MTDHPEDQISAPRPKQPCPIVSIGAGGIVHDAHLPAYRKAGLPVVAITDLDRNKAEALAKTFGIAKVAASVSEAASYAPRDAVFDVAVPASAIMAVLQYLPNDCAVLIHGWGAKWLPKRYGCAGP